MNPPEISPLKVERRVDSPPRPITQCGDEVTFIPGVSDQLVRPLIGRGLLHLSSDLSDFENRDGALSGKRNNSKSITQHQCPIHEVQLGATKAAIWRNGTDTGTRFIVKLNRIYKDGDEWKSAESFGRDDLLPLGKVADLARSWIHQRKQPKQATLNKYDCGRTQAEDWQSSVWF